MAAASFFPPILSQREHVVIGGTVFHNTDGTGNTTEEKSSVFSLIRVH